MANEKIRLEATKAGVKLWQIADRLKLNDGNFSRKLRNELSNEEQEKIFLIIQELREDAKNE